MFRIREVVREAFLISEGPAPGPRAMRVCKGDEMVDLEIGCLCVGGARVGARPLPTVHRTATRIPKPDREQRFLDEDLGSGVLAIPVRIDPLSPFVTVVDGQGGRNRSDRQESAVRRLRRRHETPRAVTANQQQADRDRKAPWANQQRDSTRSVDLGVSTTRSNRRKDSKADCYSRGVDVRSSVRLRRYGPRTRWAVCFRSPTYRVSQPGRGPQIRGSLGGGA